MEYAEYLKLKKNIAGNTLIRPHGGSALPGSMQLRASFVSGMVAKVGL